MGKRVKFVIEVIIAVAVSLITVKILNFISNM